jgi:hypothetical protein
MAANFVAVVEQWVRLVHLVASFAVVLRIDSAPAAALVCWVILVQASDREEFAVYHCSIEQDSVRLIAAVAARALELAWEVERQRVPTQESLARPALEPELLSAGAFESFPAGLLVLGSEQAWVAEWALAQELGPEVVLLHKAVRESE